MTHDIIFDLTNRLQIIMRVTQQWESDPGNPNEYDVFAWVSHKDSGGVAEAPETSVRVIVAFTMEEALQAPEVAHCFAESITLAYSDYVQAFYADILVTA